MVMFANVVQRNSQLKFDDPDHIIHDRLETLVELETHGFDVGTLRARLNQLLYAKAQVHELNDEETGQLQGTMQDLQETLVVSRNKKKMKDKEIKMLQSNVNQLANKIIGLEAEFKKFAATPL
ncbi:hypothetical protein OSB04_016620 [Centaurea solstitialis]|uniref:Uncharacterized protein n=1 Tax=Centaurea solstitialis TaxID=347529 RepID=A0AA38WHL7_9ASTR|nr:hypothetical protein OSB04_016620 [Centaurea solstitialis]